MSDPIRPAHYRTHPAGVECIVVAEAFPFSVGNAIKYLWRAGEKGPLLEDLHKARWYLDRAVCGEGPQGPTWLLQAKNILAQNRVDLAVVAGGFADWRTPILLLLFRCVQDIDASGLVEALDLLDVQIRRVGGEP